MSSFHGLEMAKQALFAQRSALHTTGHNISNANTEGYSRQRVSFQTASPYPSPGMNRPGIPGQMGTGVETGVIERIRNKFLDLQYRAENSKSGYWEAQADSLHRLEQLMNEPSESGISHTMNQFWESLGDLAANPDNSGAKSVVAQRAEALANAFNYTAESIESQRSNLESEIDVKEEKVNSLVRQIKGINDEIKQMEPHGFLANDLYDDRDRLIDELSGIVNIKVTYTESSESSPDIADGLATIELADSHGKSFGDADNEKTVLLDGTNGEIQELKVHYSENEGEKGAVSKITVGEGDKVQAFNAENFAASGSLMGNIDSYGYLKGEGDDQVVAGGHPELHQDLDEMVGAFMKEFNSVYTDEGAQNQDFFVMEGDTDSGQAYSIKVNDDILDNPGDIVASEDGYGDMASDLADVFGESLADLDGTSVNKYFESLIGNLGVKAQEANKMNQNVDTLRSQVESRRLSVSEVSLDEEMTNMIKFQHAYNAAARSMTATDEMLDRIINNMGLVGR